MRFRDAIGYKHLYRVNKGYVMHVLLKIMDAHRSLHCGAGPSLSVGLFEGASYIYEALKTWCK